MANSFCPKEFPDKKGIETVPSFAFIKDWTADVVRTTFLISSGLVPTVS
jgi:hypothetical protein